MWSPCSPVSATAAIAKRKVAARSLLSSGCPSPRLTVQGQVKTYEDRGDSGKAMYRRFCPDCGSTLMDEAEAMPGVTMIQAGTLDDASWVKPAMQIYCESAQPWVQLAGDMARFPKMPPPR
jgi:hypothetical protein